MRLLQQLIPATAIVAASGLLCGASEALTGGSLLPWPPQYKIKPVETRRLTPADVVGPDGLAYLEPVPRALEYLRLSRLSDGRLARFYELRTNKPLYCTTDYQLTEDDRDVPTHYAFKVSDGTDSIARDYVQLRALSADRLAAFEQNQTAKARPPRIAEVKAVLAAQDTRGRWIEERLRRALSASEYVQGRRCRGACMAEPVRCGGRKRGLSARPNLNLTASAFRSSKGPLAF